MRPPIHRQAFRVLGLLLAVLWLLEACGAPGERPDGPGSGYPLIVEVYATGPVQGGGDQYVRLFNPCWGVTPRLKVQ